MEDCFFTDGSFDNGDPNTTNLYLGNLNPKVYLLYNCSVYIYVVSNIIILNIFLNFSM